MTAREFAYWRLREAYRPLPDPYWIGAETNRVIASTMGDGTRKWKNADFNPCSLIETPKDPVAESMALKAKGKLFATMMAASGKGKIEAKEVK